MMFERWLHVITMGARSLFRRRELDRELDEELHWHLDHLIEANVARGMSPAAARRAALLAMGGLQQRKEDCRDQRRVRILDEGVQDVWYAVRSLSHAPAFTLAAIATLTLGIGASVAVFAVVNGVLLRPLPFPQPDRLYLVALSPRNPFVTAPALSDHNYVALHDRDQTFTNLATFSTFDGSLVGAGDPVVIKAGSVTTEFFDVLGVPAAYGRTFNADDGKTGVEQTVVLGNALWKERYGGDMSVLGRDVTLNAVRRVVIGIMPAGFEFPAGVKAWTPQVVRLSAGNSMMFPVIGRLKPDVTIVQARAQFDSVRRDLPHQPPADASSWTIGLIPLKELLVGHVRRPLSIFAGAVIFVLLVACANVAHLLLARGAHRRRELAVRVALGATRSRLVRQLLVESALLALAGGAAGLLVAQWTVPALLALAPGGRIPRLEMIRIDVWVMAFAVGASLLTALTCGLIPALRATGARTPESLLPTAGRTFGAGQERLRRTLVVGEIAVALVLLAGAGLLLKSFLRLQAVDPGFDPRRVVTLNLDLPEASYSDVPRLHVFHRDLLDRLKRVPDVTAAGLVNWRPLGTMHLNGDFSVEGRDGEAPFLVDKPAVSGGYFAAMGIRLIRGREFDSRDSATGAPVAIVSQSVARHLDPSEEVLGRRVTLESRPRADDWLTIVGVVDDVRQYGPSQPVRPAIYKPFEQVRQRFFLSHVSYVLRTSSDPRGTIPALRSALRDTDRNQAATSIALMDDIVFLATAEPRFHTRLLGTFAVLALILAAVGVYGVLAYSVAQRTHEIGVRMALGARATAVVWMVFRGTLWMGAAGVVLGSAGAFAATGLLTPFLFETTPTDLATFAAVAATMFAAALAAGAIPARRATRIDPLVALRHE
jgi:putative ABC transport system permease protein